MSLLMSGIGLVARSVHTAKRKLKGIKKGGAGALGLVGALKKEAAIGPVLHKDALAALRGMQVKDPSLTQVLQRASGYAVFPGVGKASAVLGGAFGLGEVFEQDRVIGYAAIVQLTIGIQLGGQTFRELVVFESRQALDSFKHSKVAFAANASAVIVKAGAAASAAPGATKVFVQSEGGLGIEAAIGGQKFIYKPAALGRLKTGKLPQVRAPEAGKTVTSPPPPPPH